MSAAGRPYMIQVGHPYVLTILRGLRLTILWFNLVSLMCSIIMICVDSLWGCWMGVFLKLQSHFFYHVLFFKKTLQTPKPPKIFFSRFI